MSVRFVLRLPLIAKNIDNLTHIYWFIHGNIMRIADNLANSKKDKL